ncbi:hypothetical protein AB6866_04850 [Rahnella inusitata]|uniref:hypothetical protein n=1 Tax=Rahnella inusitata TaxID=58169 RepID=UPI0039BE3237
MESNIYSILTFIVTILTFVIIVFLFRITPTLAFTVISFTLTIAGSSYSLSEKYRKFIFRKQKVDILGVCSVAICLLSIISAYVLKENTSEIEKYAFYTLFVVSILFLCWDSKKSKNVTSIKVTESFSKIVETNTDITITTKIKK